jgi:hypothetical protein
LAFNPQGHFIGFQPSFFINLQGEICLSHLSLAPNFSQFIIVTDVLRDFLGEMTSCNTVLGSDALSFFSRCIRQGLFGGLDSAWEEGGTKSKCPLCTVAGEMLDFVIAADT